MYTQSQLCLSFLIMVFLFSCKQKNGQAQQLFTDDRSEWIERGDASWSFAGKELKGTANGGSGFVMTRRRFANFILELDFYPDSTINSGVFIRCQGKALSAAECYELNIWDRHPDQDSRTGAVVQRSTPLNLVQTIDRWNHYKIICRNETITAWINDQKVVDIRDSSLIEGFIGLQAAESGSVRFKNVLLTVLKE